MRDLLRNALRMRPDRIVIGEVRGPEALDLLTALNTGHDGALSTVHANSPADALRRLETLALMAGLGLPHEAIAEQVQRGIDLVVHLERRPDGGAGRRDRRGVRAGGTASRLSAERDGRDSAAAGRRRAGRLGRARGCARRLLASPAARRAGCGGAGAAAPGRPRGLRALDASSAAALPRSARPRRSLAGWFLAGPALAVPLAVAGPALAAWAVASRRRRYRARGRAGAARGRDRDRRLARRRALAARLALPAAATSLDGPAAVELARLGAELELGAPTAQRARRPGGGACARRGSTPSPPPCSASASPAATSPGCCAASPRARPSATGPPRTPARRPRRPASPACSWSRCRPAARSSPS